MAFEAVICRSLSLLLQLSVLPLIVCHFVESYKGCLINQLEFEQRQQSQWKGVQ